MSWYLDNNNKLTHDALPEPIDRLYSEPYPATFWRLNSNNILTLNSEDWEPFQEPIYDILTPPYPASMWYMTDTHKLRNMLLIERIPFGAFARCEDIKTVMLPESLESIGRESFAESGLTKIKIPNNQCTYYATSFPPGCVVTGGRLIE